MTLIPRPEWSCARQKAPTSGRTQIPRPEWARGSVQGSDHLKGSDQRPDPDPAPDPVVRSVQVVDPEDDEQPGTALQILGIGPVCPRRNCPPDETLPICGDRPTEPCRMGNSTFTPPDDVPDIGQGDPGEIPWGGHTRAQVPLDKLLERGGGTRRHGAGDLHALSSIGSRDPRRLPAAEACQVA